MIEPMYVVELLLLFFLVFGFTYSLIGLYRTSVELYALKRKTRIAYHNMVANMENREANKDEESALQWFLSVNPRILSVNPRILSVNPRILSVNQWFLKLKDRITQDKMKEMSQLANRAELMVLSETFPLKIRRRPLMRPGFRKPRVKKVSWSDKIITEYIIYPEILITDNDKSWIMISFFIKLILF